MTPTRNDVEPTTSATDELRRLLDERGVEYRFNDATKVFEWHFDGTDGEGSAHATEVNGGVNIMACSLTPEQAVEATLGRGTCRLEPYAKEICGELCHTFKCSACKTTVATPRVDYYIPSQLFKYCPFCGRRVVEE